MGEGGRQENNWGRRKKGKPEWLCCCSVAKSFLTVFNHMKSTPNFPVLHCLLEFAQTHVHWVDDASHFILCYDLLLLSSIFPRISVFSNESALCVRWPQSFEASASVFPMNIKCWFPLGLTGLISLMSKGPSRVFSSTTVQKHQFFRA